jgi:hypothetical protein
VPADHLTPGGTEWLTTWTSMGIQGFNLVAVEAILGDPDAQAAAGGA